MKRSEFIKSLGLAAGGLVLPPTLFQHKQVKIYDNYISGLQYYAYNKIKKTLKEGTILHLKREPENLYDSFAVAIYYNENKLGYLRAYENICIANMLDAGTELKATISSHAKASKYDYHTLSIAVFVELISGTPKLISELQNLRADDAPDLYRKKN